MDERDYQAMKKDTRSDEIFPYVTGCFIINNEKPPNLCKYYKVIYTDGTHGMEYFNGNMWLVKYKHPVKMWWLILH